jgi:hypothetical protein
LGGQSGQSCIQLVQSFFACGSSTHQSTSYLERPTAEPHRILNRYLSKNQLIVNSVPSKYKKIPTVNQGRGQTRESSTASVLLCLRACPPPTAAHAAHTPAHCVRGSGRREEAIHPLKRAFGRLVLISSLGCVPVHRARSALCLLATDQVFPCIRTKSNLYQTTPARCFGQMTCTVCSAPPHLFAPRYFCRYLFNA